MNKLFGFFKQKIVEANIQNKKDLQSLVNVLSGDDTGYKSQIILSHLQKIKSNYMTWSILIANQASTGLYYSQLHNHNVCLKKVNCGKQIESTIQKYGIAHKQMKKTHQQLKQIGSLNQNWVHNMSQRMQQIKSLRMRRLQQNNLRVKQVKIRQLEQRNELDNKQVKQEQIQQRICQKRIDEDFLYLQNKDNLQQQQRYPIILAQVIDPIIQLSLEQNNNEIMVKNEKW